MGANMFSNGRETYVGTSSSNVFAEYENPNKQLMLSAIKLNASIASTFKEAYPLQISKRSKSVFRKATSTVFKRPTEAIDCSVLSDLAADYISDHMGTSDISVRVEEDAEYIQDIVETILVNIFGWNSKTDAISIPPEAVPALNELAYYIVNLTSNSVDFTFIGNGITHTINYPIVPNLATGTVMYCTAKNKAPFNYTYGSGVTVLDDAIKTIAAVVRGSKSTGYFPVIPFYIDDFEVSATSNSTDQRYIDAKRLLKTIGMDYEQTATHLRESVAEYTGDHKGLYAYMMYGVDPMKGVFKQTGTAGDIGTHADLVKDHQGSLNYLFEYFLDKKTTSVFSVAAGANLVFSKKNEPKSIQISDKSFQSEIKYNSITVVYFPSDNTNVGQVLGEYFPKVGISKERLVYTKQLSSTVSCAVTIYSLVQEFTVHNGHTTEVKLSQGFDPDIPSDVPNVEGVQLRLPLHKLYADRVKNNLQNELYHHALCFIFNSYQNVKVKWYQDAGWGFVIKIAAIIFALPSGGQSFTWSSLLTTALKFIVQTVIVRLTIKGLIKLFGIDAVAALILVASAYGYFGKSYETAFQCVQGLPFADVLLKMSLNMWSAYSSELKEMEQDLQKEMEDLNAEMDRQQEELLTAKKLLDTGADDLNPWLFVNPLPEHSFGEYPEQMIDRLLSGVRIPDIVVNAPSNYVDLMLTLPTFDETIRMNTRGK